jgi:hypothetical protein
MTDLEHDNYVHPGPRFARNGFTTGQGQGMSLRDAAALAALPAVIEVCKHDTCGLDETKEQMFARKAFQIADAFIAVRETKEDEG